MPTNSEIIQNEQIQEQDLRFNFIYNAQQVSAAIKQIGREYPDLRAKDLQTLQQLNRLAANLLTNPNQISSIPNFSLTYGAEFEANIIVNGVPFEDFQTIQTQKFIQALDGQIQNFSKSLGLTMPGFVPTNFTNTTGWTLQNTISVKNLTEEQIATKLGVSTGSLSFNDTEQYVYQNPTQFTNTQKQALQIYRVIVLKNLNDIIVYGLQHILEDILIVAGSSLFSNISSTLGTNLNLTNQQILQISVTAEQDAVKNAIQAAKLYGAIFPQLRQA